MKYKRCYEEGGETFEDGTFNAKDRKDAFSKVKPLNLKYAGWRYYFFDEIKEEKAPTFERPVITRVVAV